MKVNLTLIMFDQNDMNPRINNRYRNYFACGIIYFLLIISKPIYGMQAFTDTVVAENEKYRAINYIDVSDNDRNYYKFLHLLDTGYITSAYNKFSRLVLIDKATNQTIFNIPTILTTKILLRKEGILCLSTYLVRGLPQIAVVSYTGKYLGVEAIPGVFCKCHHDSFNRFRNNYELKLIELKNIRAIRKRSDYYIIELQRVMSLGNLKAYTPLEDTLSLKCDCDNLDTKYNYTISSLPAIYWFDSKRMYFRINKKRNGSVRNVVYTDVTGKRAKLKFYKHAFIGSSEKHTK